MLARRPTLALLIACLASAGCDSSPTAPPAGRPVAFSVIINGFGFNNLLEPRQEIAVRDQASLEALWAKLIFNGIAPDPPPVVDFGRETVIAVTGGAEGCCLVEPEVENIATSVDAGLEVEAVRWHETVCACPCIGYGTPVQIVRVAATAATVRFTVDDRGRACR